MRLDPTNFLHSLAKLLVATAAAQTPAVTITYPGALRIQRNPEQYATDPYSTIRVYPGNTLTWGDRTDQLSIQIETIGTLDSAVLSRAQCLFECFTSGDGYPIRMVDFNGYKFADDSADGTYRLIAAMPLQRPGMIGRETDRGRPIVTFNVDLQVIKTA